MIKKDTKYDTFERLTRPYPFRVSVIKTKVQAKSRQLKATWILENVQDCEHEIDDELVKILEEELKKK